MNSIVTLMKSPIDRKKIGIHHCQFKLILLLSVEVGSRQVGGKKCSNYPPLEFMKLHRLPPRRNRNGNLRQLPPLEFMELHRLPPLEMGTESCANYPPVEFMELHRLPPPLEIGTESCANYPPSEFIWNFIDYPPPSIFN